MYKSSSTNSLHGGGQTKSNMKNNFNNRPDCLNDILSKINSTSKGGHGSVPNSKLMSSLFITGFDIDEVEAVLSEDANPFNKSNSKNLLDEIRTKILNPEIKQVVAGNIKKENQLIFSSNGTPALSKQEEYALKKLLDSRMTLDTLPKLQPPTKAIKRSNSGMKIFINISSYVFIELLFLSYYYKYLIACFFN
jgi:hypothetical protein